MDSSISLCPYGIKHVHFINYNQARVGCEEYSRYDPWLIATNDNDTISSRPHNSNRTSLTSRWCHGGYVHLFLIIFISILLFYCYLFTTSKLECARLWLFLSCNFTCILFYPMPTEVWAISTKGRRESKFSQKTSSVTDFLEELQTTMPIYSCAQLLKYVTDKNEWSFL